MFAAAKNGRRGAPLREMHYHKYTPEELLASTRDRLNSLMSSKKGRPIMEEYCKKQQDIFGSTKDKTHGGLLFEG